MTYAAMILSDVRFWVCLGVLLAVAYRLGWKAGQYEAKDPAYRQGYRDGINDMKKGKP